MPGRAALAAVVALGLLAACGTPAARGPSPGPLRSPAPVPSSPSPTPEPTATPAPATRTPAPAPEPAPTRFTARVAATPGARIRFGPGLELPVLDLVAAGMVLVFDGWYRHLDEAPVPDVVTGRVESWSRDWYRLASGHGWVHSSVVVGLPPAGLAPVSWQRPGALPAPAAGVIDVELDRQDLHATCEAAALKMALAALGIVTQESSILALTGVDARPPEEDDAGAIARWGNPHSSFVGNPDGSAAAHTGYGVYPEPIARAASALGARVVASGAGIAPADLYAAVIAGRPAVAWVTSDYSRGSLGTWRAWDGTVVRWSAKEHAVTLVGVTPSMVVIDDPWWGQLWKPRAEFENAYATFGGMAVVIG